MSERDKDLPALRRAFQARDARAEAAPGPAPTADELWAVANGELRGDKARAVLEHVARDPEVATEWRLTMALVREAGIEPAWDEQSEPRVVESRRRWPTAWFLGWGAAAVAVAILVFILLPTKTRDEPQVPPTLRTTGQFVIKSAVGPELARGRFELRWSGAPAGSRYEVHITTTKLRRVHSEFDLRATSLVVRPDAFKGLAAATPLVWRVVAITAKGERIESPAFDVRLK